MKGAREIELYFNHRLCTVWVHMMIHYLSIISYYFFFPFSIFDELIHNAVLILASSKKGSDIGLSVAKRIFFFVSFAAIQ